MGHVKAVTRPEPLEAIRWPVTNDPETQAANALKVLQFIHDRGGSAAYIPRIQSPDNKQGLAPEILLNTDVHGYIKSRTSFETYLHMGSWVAFYPPNSDTRAPGNFVVIFDAEFKRHFEITEEVD